MEEKAEQPGGTSNSQKRNQWKQTLLTSSEGRVLLIGVALAFTYTAWLAVKLLVFPEQSQVLIGITATGIIFGRAAGMAFGYSLGMGHSTVISICIVIETVQVLVFYPLFVFSWRHLLILKWLKRIMERTHQAAERHKEKIQKYGVIGLFAFVWFPFWMTGPVVGSVIGFLLGLPVWLNMTVVLAGTYTAILCWAFFLRRLHQQVASYSPYAAMTLMALLVVIIIAGHLLLSHPRRNKSAQRPADKEDT
jgi:uncharacterized membrane protein